jgi:hypothetical protein
MNTFSTRFLPQSAAADFSFFPEVQNARAFLESYPELRDPVIDGLLRKGETMNVIASTKQGKSWLTLGLGIAVANGMPWLGHNTEQGRVLLVDNELHPETISWRLKQVQSANQGIAADNIDVLPLRGQGKSLNIFGLCSRLQSNSVVSYKLVIIDALYRLLPAGHSENDNAQMTQVYNAMDELAAKTNAAIVVVHHASKGSQNNKKVTDIGCGAGAISRTVDTHLTLRPHEDTELAVMHATTRSFPSPPLLSIRFDFPVWSLADQAPQLRAPNREGNQVQSHQDEQATGVILDVLPPEGLTKNAIKEKLRWGSDRVARILKRMLDQGVLEIVDVKRSPKKTEKRYKRRPVAEPSKTAV